MNFVVQDAIRKKVYPKIGIFSPSGGGKTYTSLRLASGMIKKMKEIDGKDYEIWLANNEGDRGLYYANEFKYKIINIVPPHDPETYIDLIKFAEQNEECGVLIIDSFSKEWAGEGGCLEIAQKLGGQYQKAWRNVTPRHRALMEVLNSAKVNIIATMRGEDQYVMSTDEKTNKTNLEKIGLGAKQGKDFEYEFSCTLSLDQKTNSAESFKDNTHIFENMPPRKLTENDGMKIIEWANSDVAKAETANPTPQKPQATKNEENKKSKIPFNELKIKSAQLCQEKMGIKGKEEILKIISEKLNGKKLNETNEDNYEEVQCLYDTLNELQ